MATRRIIEVYHIEFWFDLVTVQIVEQVVVSNFGKVGIFEIVQENGKTFLDYLLNVLIDNCIGLPAARSSQYHCRTKNINKVNPSVIRLSPEPKAGTEIDGILVLFEFGFLHKALVLDIEHVFKQVGFEQAGHPQPCHEQQDISCREGGDVEHRVCR